MVATSEHQGRGIGSVVVPEHLAAAAQESGSSRFVAVVLLENQAMLRVVSRCRLRGRRSFDGGEVHLEFDVARPRLTESVMRGTERTPTPGPSPGCCPPASGSGRRSEQR